VWWNGQIAPGDLGIGATIELLIVAVIGGLGRIEGAWIGAFAFIVINNYVTNWVPSGGLPVVGGRFSTVIGLVFLAIVIVSPDGLTGLWDRVWDRARRRGAPPSVPVEVAESAGTVSS
jgi:branched-chain amino acid transport system permease protein